jgi:hypothetical protein
MLFYEDACIAETTAAAAILQSCYTYTMQQPRVQ